MILYFLGLFVWFQYDFLSGSDLYKKDPEKKFFYSGKCRGTKDVYNNGKKGA